MNSIQGDPNHDKQRDAELARINGTLERLVQSVSELTRRFDDFAGAFLNARFPYGRATDRWRRR